MIKFLLMHLRAKTRKKRKDQIKCIVPPYNPCMVPFTKNIYFIISYCINLCHVPVKYQYFVVKNCNTDDVTV